jgi:hypothetical protein
VIVTIGAREIELVKPSSIARRWHVVMNLVRPGREDVAAWAALGLCWPDYQRRHPYMGDVMSFGQGVADTLLGEGVPYVQLATAAGKAAAYIQEGLAPVEGAPDFSATPAAGSPSGIESSASSS